MRSLSIVIPAYDEARSIEPVVRESLRVAKEVCPNIEVLVCDDGSTDGTGAIADRLAAADARVRVLHEPRNRGIEASIRRLYAAARGEYIFLICADGQWPAESLLSMARAIRDGADIVVGTRSNKRRVYTVYRRLLSAAYGWIVVALGSSAGDPGSIKLGRADLLRAPVVSRGVFAEGERLIRAARAGHRIDECPVEFQPRRSGRATGAAPKVVARAALDAVRASSSLLFGWPRPEPIAGSAVELRPRGLVA